MGIFMASRCGAGLKMREAHFVQGLHCARSNTITHPEKEVSPYMSTRIDRISEEVMKALAEALRSVKDPRVQEAMVSVVHCDVTNDLRYAKCYISVLGSEQQAKDVMKGLRSASGWLRREVGRRVQLRYAPELVFELDESITRGAHISELLHELKNEGRLGGEDEE